MSQATITVDARLHAYLLAHSLREHPALAALRAESDGLAEAGMRSSPEQMQLIALLLELIGARRVLEIGCFTGYGTLAMALALPPDGEVTTLDVNDQWAAIGRRYWKEAGVAGRIRFTGGLAADSLDALIAGGAAASFDMAYVDADKKSYDLYYERALALVRPGGLIALDNILWHGAVADPADTDRQTETLRRLTEKIRRDERVTMSLVPVGDGVMLCRKR